MKSFKTFLPVSVALVLLWTALTARTHAAPMGTAFTYQGRLQDGTNAANGIYDLRFTIYDAVSGGNQVGPALTSSAVGVTNGVFVVLLDFGPNVFTGQALWLESAVRTNGAGGFSPLPPREPLTAAPYALYTAQAASASSVASAAISATSLNTPLAAAPGQVLTYNGSSLAWMTLSGNNTPSWLLSGNAGTAPGTHFLGTTDNQPLELKVNGQRALRIEPGVNGLPNLVGGAPVNTVDAGVFGAVIGGGGEPAWPNQVSSDHGTIAGGKGNRIGGGGLTSTVGGGILNTIEQNTLDSVIGGGHGNVIQSSSFYGFIGGGQNNTNGHLSVGAVIPGGRDNFASGMLSFAAGTRAKAMSDGTFVWADYTEADFASTANNQFLIRANGGVGIGTNNPQSALHVVGTVTADAFAGPLVTGGDLAAARLAVGTNQVLTGRYATVAGGQANTNSGDYAAIGGGEFNSIGAGTEAAVIGGGEANRIETNSFLNSIGGGVDNYIGSFGLACAIGGGEENRIQSFTRNYWSTIAGGRRNSIGDGALRSTISGGIGNTIATGGLDCVIAGGDENFIQTNASVCVIGGGGGNVVGTNALGSVVSGGAWNSISAPYYAVIPGGRSNEVAGSFALAAGQNAKARHDGAFVWSDYSSQNDFASTAPNQFLIRAAGGVGINKANPATALDVNGTIAGVNFVGGGGGLTSLNGAALQSGSVTADRLSANQVVKSLNGLRDDVVLSAGANVTLTTNGNVLSIAAAGGGGIGGWSTTGNAGTTPGVNFVGTTDKQPLEFWVNNVRALRLEPTANGLDNSNMVNVVGGSPANYIAPGVGGSVIAGGGAVCYQNYSPNTNSVSSVLSFLGGGLGNSINWTDDFSFLGGGWDNSIQSRSMSSFLGGGQHNSIEVYAGYSFLGGGMANTNRAGYSFLGGGSDNANDSQCSFLGGGEDNSIQTYADHSFLGGGFGNNISSHAPYATIAGGASNLVSAAGAFIGGGGYDGANAIGNAASGVGSVISGGTANVASGSRSTVAGGHDNSATNWYATVPGGAWNTAGGLGSFAAGQTARALNDGCFVWNCDWNNVLASMAANQFLARASGGFFFYTGTSGGAMLAPGSGSWTSLSDRHAKENFAPVNSQAVLEKVAELPLSTWNYRAQDPAIRHLGPTAQDFKAAFGLGETDTGITGVDADGVALAAIQGLNQRLKERDAEIQALKQRLEALEKLVGQLTSN